MLPSRWTIYEGDDLIRNRIDSILARLAKSARGTGWVLGLFSADGDLLDFAISSAQIPRRRAMDLLCAAPPPGAPQSVILRITGTDGKIADDLSASMKLDANRSLALVLMRAHASDAAWRRISEGVKGAIVRIAAEVSAESSSGVDRTRAPRPFGEEAALFLLTPQLHVALASLSVNAASTEFAKLVAPQSDRLLPLLERCVARLTKSWDLSRIESCRPEVAHPLPGLALRVEPMTGNGISIAVRVKRVAQRHPLADAVAKYRFSPRERQVLHALLDGRSVVDIAGMLDLAESTVSDHIARMLVKTNAHNRVELAALVLGWPALRAHLGAQSHSGDGTAAALLSGDVTDSLPRSVRTNGETPRRVSWRYKIGSTR
jgi:DNA-binding CsgD family transcriptional regulator